MAKATEEPITADKLSKPQETATLAVNQTDVNSEVIQPVRVGSDIKIDEKQQETVIKQKPKPNINVTIPTKRDEFIPYKPGVTIEIIKEGDKRNYPKKGDTIVVDYTGTLHGGINHNKQFDSAKGFKVQIGCGNVIKGWDIGFTKVSLGAQAKLKISWNYGYGLNGFDDGSIIGPKQDLLFVIHLKKINGKIFSNIKAKGGKELSRKERRELERKKKKNKNKKGNKRNNKPKPKKKLNNNNNQKTRMNARDIIESLQSKDADATKKINELKKKNPELRELMDKITQLRLENEPPNNVRKACCDPNNPNFGS